jgi:hypothetical protein
MFILSITLPNLSIPDVPFSTLLSTLISRQFQVKPTTLLVPIDLILFLLVEESYGPGTKVAPFPYFMWKVVFYCLLLVFFFVGRFLLPA